MAISLRDVQTATQGFNIEKIEATKSQNVFNYKVVSEINKKES